MISHLVKWSNLPWKRIWNSFSATNNTILIGGLSSATEACIRISFKIEDVNGTFALPSKFICITSGVDGCSAFDGHVLVFLCNRWSREQNGSILILGQVSSRHLGY